MAETAADLLVEKIIGWGTVERPEEIRPALQRAIASGKPALTIFRDKLDEL